MKHLFIFLVLALFSSALQASYKSDVYKAFVNNRMSDWKILIDQLNIRLVKDNSLLPELLNYQYGYIGWYITNNRKDEAIEYLKLAEDNVRLLETKNLFMSLVNGYKSAFYGYHIALNKFSAPFNGHKSSECARQAILLDPDQPFGYIQSGNVKFHSPYLMGGSKKEAIKYFLKAKTMMENKGKEIYGDWNYLNLMVTIAKAYESMNDMKNAKMMYEEILKIEPEFSWVRDELYPLLLKKCE